MLGSVDPFASQMIDCDTQAPFSVDPGLEDDGDGDGDDDGEEDEGKVEASSEPVVPVAKAGVRPPRRIIAEEEQEEDEDEGDNEEEEGESEPKESQSRIYVTPPKRKATREEGKTSRDDKRRKKRRRRRDKMSEEEEDDDEEVVSEEPATAAKVGSVNNKFRLGGQPSTERPNDSKLQWRLNAKPDPLARRLGREENEDDENEGEAEAESSIRDTIEDIDHEEEPQRGTSIPDHCCRVVVVATPPYSSFSSFFAARVLGAGG
jgi:hypothetical protein